MRTHWRLVSVNDSHRMDAPPLETTAELRNWLGWATAAALAALQAYKTLKDARKDDRAAATSEKDNLFRESLEVHNMQDALIKNLQADNAALRAEVLGLKSKGRPG